MTAGHSRMPGTRMPPSYRLALHCLHVCVCVAGGDVEVACASPRAGQPNNVQPSLRQKKAYRSPLLASSELRSPVISELSRCGPG